MPLNADTAQSFALRFIAAYIDSEGIINKTPCWACIMSDGELPCMLYPLPDHDDNDFLDGACSNCVRAGTWESCCWKYNSLIVSEKSSFDYEGFAKWWEDATLPRKFPPRPTEKNKHSIGAYIGRWEFFPYGRPASPDISSETTTESNAREAQFGEYVAWVIAAIGHPNEWESGQQGQEVLDEARRTLAPPGEQYGAFRKAVLALMSIEPFHDDPGNQDLGDKPEGTEAALADDEISNKLEEAK